ncbi:hypothetical protein F5884DRAFT_56115 [Xylogone sp. PMI_703]|nr:hypothetical protein F5884DRAFT_56115 [Xylogone sp. PMI_703]
MFRTMVLLSVIFLSNVSINMKCDIGKTINRRVRLKREITVRCSRSLTCPGTVSYYSSSQRVKLPFKLGEFREIGNG